MKNIKLTLIVLSFVIAGNFSISAQNTHNISRGYTGPINKKDLSTSYTKSWFNNGMKNFDISQEMLEKFKATDYKDYTIKVFMGTWCPDSRREIPKFYKLLDKLNFDLDRVKNYTMDYYKSTDKNYEKGLNVHHIPTIIVYDKNGNEINRFVEHPRRSFLKDMLRIFQQKPYKNVYAK